MFVPKTAEGRLLNFDVGDWSMFLLVGLALLGLLLVLV